MFEWTISSSLINTCMEYNPIQINQFNQVQWKDLLGRK